MAPPSASTIKAWYHLPYQSDHQPIIIGGSGRSGTTLVRVILDTHSQIACGPESYLFLDAFELVPHGKSQLSHYFDTPSTTIDQLKQESDSHAEFIQKFFTHYTQSQNKTIWAEKTPKNVTVLPYIFNHFPQARFIHVIRDGRDVTASLMHHPRHRLINGQLQPTGIKHPLLPCFNRWHHDVQAGLSFRHHPHYYELKYEDLVQNPQSTLKHLFDFLHLPLEDHLLNFHQVNTSSRDVTKFPQNPEATQPLYSHSIGRWQQDLTASEKKQLLHLASPLLQQLNYL